MVLLVSRTWLLHGLALRATAWHDQVCSWKEGDKLLLSSLCYYQQVAAWEDDKLDDRLTKPHEPENCTTLHSRLTIDWLQRQ